MELTSRRLASMATIMVGIAAVLLMVPRNEPLSPAPAPAPVEPFRPATTSTASTISTSSTVEGPDVGLCDLLLFAAQADPVLQYAAGRSADDIDAVAAVQRDVLLAAANLVEAGPETDALIGLADVFIDPASSTAPARSIGPGRWTEEQWSDALVARADGSVLSVLADLESQC